MADNEIGIAVSGDIADISSKLDDLTGQLDGIGDKTIDVSVNASGFDQLESSANDSSTALMSIGETSETTAYTIADNMTTIAIPGIEEVQGAADHTTSSLLGTGDASAEASTNIESDMGNAVLAVEAVGIAAEKAAEQIYGLTRDSEQLSTYTGIASDDMKGMETDLSGAAFPIEDVDKYLTVLTQLGVPNKYLKGNAQAMNEIGLGTGATADDVVKFASDIKALGGDVNNLAKYYGMAGYVQDNVVGGFSAFAQYAKVLGPKLKDMGFTAEESAVIIGKLSQKYGGNIRGMRGAISAADGDGNKLLGTLNMTHGEVDSGVASFGQYADKVHETATVSRETRTPLEQLWADLKDIGLLLGPTGASFLSFAGFALIGAGAVGILAKALDWLNITQNASKTYGNVIRTSLSKVGSGLKWGGKYFLDLIKGWNPGFKKAGSGNIIEMTKGMDGGYEMKKPLLSRIGSGMVDVISKGLKTGLVGFKNLGGMIVDGIFGGIKAAFAIGGWTAIRNIALTGLFNALRFTPLDLALLGADLPGNWLYNITHGLAVIDYTPLNRFKQDVINALKFDTSEKGSLADQLNFGGWLNAHLINPIQNWWPGFSAYLSTLPGQVYDWGKNIITAWIQGMVDKLEGDINYIKGAFGNFMKFLKGESPPKEGPLKDIDKWGINVGKAYVSGITEGISGIGGLSTALNVNNSIPIPSAPTSNFSNSSMNINVSLEGANINSQLDAQEVGNTIGSSLADKLKGQATNAGIDVVNARR